jgi:hypothetical protein
MMISRWTAGGLMRAQQTVALGAVFASIDADGIMVIEGPDSNIKRDGAAALECFASQPGIRARRSVIGHVNYM